MFTYLVFKYKKQVIIEWHLLAVFDNKLAGLLLAELQTATIQHPIKLGPSTCCCLFPSAYTALLNHPPTPCYSKLYIEESNKAQKY
jgi:hypothetical protein